MTDAADDLDALFDEIAAQRTEPAIQPPEADVPQSAEISESIEQHASIPPARSSLDEDLSGNSMYERLGNIVRLLHDSLRELGYDRSLSDVAHQITDAQGRLEYIATLTEQAAIKVLNAVDSGMPAQDELASKAKDMGNRWASLFEGNLSIEEFKQLAGDSKQFAAVVADATEAEKARLLDIMMAQDFQDITGQLIKKIVGITGSVERELAQLLRDNAPPEIKAAMAESKAPVELMSGPSIDGKAMAQDDVDGLLADLGF